VTTALWICGGISLLTIAAFLVLGRNVARRREAGQFPETHKPTDQDDSTDGGQG
jgi:hypothetical protein